MRRGAPAQKIAITVDQDVHAKVLRAANEENMGVSAWMTEAARHALRIREGLAAVADWEAEHGAFTDAEMRAARARVSRDAARTVPRRRRRRS